MSNLVKTLHICKNVGNVYVYTLYVLTLKLQYTTRLVKHKQDTGSWNTLCVELDALTSVWTQLFQI